MSTNEETRNRIRPLVAGIVAELGAPWHTTGNEADTFGLKLTDGTITLYAHTGYNLKGRLRVIGSYPDGARHIYTPAAFCDRTETTVSLDRDPKAAARQILAKLVPDVRTATAYFAEHLAQDTKALTMRREFLAEIKVASNDDEANNARVHVDEVWGDLRVGYEATSNELKLHSLTGLQVAQILSVLRGPK